MRTSRLLELLLLLQVRGRASARELAETLEVSVRTVYRDVSQLAAAGVPVYTEAGRNGGVRLVDGYRPGAVTGFDRAEARAAVLAGIPSVARDIGIDVDGAGEKLLATLDVTAEEAVRQVRERLVVETEPWWGPKDDQRFLPQVAQGVWETREVRISYDSGRGRGASSRVIRPLGLVLKGGTWYVVASDRRDASRVYRVSRIVDATVLPHAFDRPAGFDLLEAWEARKQAFEASIPTYVVDVRVSPDGERHLPLLQEGTPPLPLDTHVPRDADGWAILSLRFERPHSAVRLLLQLGADVEVIRPPEARALMASAAASLAALYEAAS